MESLLKKIWSLTNPEEVRIRWFEHQIKMLRGEVKRLAPLSEAELRAILTDEVGLKRGDVVCVHSAVGLLNLAFKPPALLELLLDVVGAEGTLVMPTYPDSSLEFLKSGQIFDVKTTSSAKTTGILTDLLRQHPLATRSVHPTKSMAAVGPRAHDLFKDHHRSVFPYNENSPYFRLSQMNAKIIGLGVWTYNLSFVHAVDDTMREQFPLCPHAPQLFQAICRLPDGQTQIVRTYAHDLKKILYDTLHVHEYMRRYVQKSITREFTVSKRRFFLVDSRQLYRRMVELARENITIYRSAQRRSEPNRERGLWRDLIAKAGSQEWN
jgi:aminoglycoside 3-N-acetyltransferase